MAGVLQKISKLIGTKIPYPVYEVPFRFRNQDRIIQYTLFQDRSVVRSKSWLKCEEMRTPESQYYNKCICCAEDLNAVEEIDMLITVSTDVMKPGNPVE